MALSPKPFFQNFVNYSNSASTLNSGSVNNQVRLDGNSQLHLLQNRSLFFADIAIFYERIMLATLTSHNRKIVSSVNMDLRNQIQEIALG
jgi:hypothetical protein